jgi:hypothetical protein
VSWPYLTGAAALRRLPIEEKGVAMALGDHADLAGRVALSNKAIRDWTSLSRDMVRRALERLAGRGLILCVDPPTHLACGVYQLHYRVARGSQQLPGSPELPDRSEARNLVAGSHLNDHLLIPSNKSRKAGTAGAAPVENVGNEPTTKQVTKFVHELMADNRYDHQTLNADLTADMKSLLRTRNFDYDTPLGLENLRKGIDSGLAQYARAKGQQR